MDDFEVAPNADGGPVLPMFTQMNVRWEGSDTAWREASRYNFLGSNYSLVLNRSHGATIKHNPDFPLISSITSMFFGERMACLVFPPGFQLFLYAS